MNANELISEMKGVSDMAGAGFNDFMKSARTSSGDWSQSANSGDWSQSASSGDWSQSASSGNSSRSASSGDWSQSASSGNSSRSASSGNSSRSASSGNSSRSASSGDFSRSASSGDFSQSASSGNFSQSASSGNFSQSASSGASSGCSAIGYRSAVSGDIGNLLMCSEFKKDGTPVGGLCAIVDGKILRPGSWYIVEGMKWVEVDFTDGVFSYVLSNRNGVKRVRFEDGRIQYIVGDGNGSFAHGGTIKDARKDLIYKVQTKFDGFVPDSETGEKWIVIYRSITGACSSGVRNFVESNKLDLKKTYTKHEVVNIVDGHFGCDKFSELVNSGALD